MNETRKQAVFWVSLLATIAIYILFLIFLAWFDVRTFLLYVFVGILSFFPTLDATYDNVPPSDAYTEGDRWRIRRQHIGNWILSAFIAWFWPIAAHFSQKESMRRAERLRKVYGM